MGGGVTDGAVLSYELYRLPPVSFYRLPPGDFEPGRRHNPLATPRA